MDLEDLVHHDFCRFFGRWQFGQSNKSDHLGEPIHQRENGGVALRSREPRDEVERDVCPRSGGDGKRLLEPDTSPGTSLVSGADRTCLYVLPDPHLHGWPPEPPGFGEQCSLDSRVT